MFTETICNMTNVDLCKNVRFPVHPLEEQMGIQYFFGNKDLGPDMEAQRPIKWSHKNKIQKRVVPYMDVFVNDFIAVSDRTHR
jgi:hypothetical protein